MDYDTTKSIGLQFAMPSSHHGSLTASQISGRLNSFTFIFPAIADTADFKLRKGCAICDDISDSLMAPYEKPLSFYIGSVEELSSMPCVVHLDLLELLLTPTILEEPYSTIMIHKLRDPYIRLFADSEEENDYTITSSPGFGLVKKESTGYGRILDSQWIDCTLMEQWKSDCCTLHHSKCRRLPNSTFLAPASPNWLVDVSKRCIVAGRPGMTYVALSYVWGAARNFRAMRSNKQQLQNPGALDSGGLDIPRTIRDAMNVVAILREHYLWVDALCIIQDEYSTKQDQLNNMASIYAEATVTIIAKDGSDSSHGLHGVPGSVARNLHQEIFKLSNEREAIVHPWSVDKKFTPWASRGWTFQEELFSPRRLIFEGQTIRWECSVATWHEDNDFNTITECNDADESQLSQASNLFTEQRPNIEWFGHLIAVYNKREFTYSVDTLNALDGILSSLTAFKGGFVWGLPHMFFDLALLWQPELKISRRAPKDDDENDILPPSWSWAGWQGEIDTKSWERGLNANEDSSTRVSSVVTWYLGDLREEKRELLKNCPSLPFAHTMERLLSCKTEKCFLYLGEPHCRNRAGKITFYSLLDKQGKWAGSLRPHHNIPRGEVVHDAGDGMCELVSISKGSVSNSEYIHSSWIDEWYLPERPKLSERYNFHNILWIFWEHGIAYRRGLGRVVEEVWQEQDGDEIMLVLG
jgi:hypothetical protein